MAQVLEIDEQRPEFPAETFSFTAMKKALLLALASLFAAVSPALAYPPVPANVNFSSERGVPFGLVLDGRPLTRGLARQVHVDQLMPGQHWADFSVPTAYGGAVRFRSRVWLEPGLETTFVLVTRPGRPLYLQQVNAVALYAPGYGGNGYYSGGGGHYNSPAPYGQGYGSNEPYDDYNDGDSYNTTPAPNGGYGNNPNAPSNGGYNTTPAPNGGYGNNPNLPNNGGYNNGPTPGNYPGTATSSYRSLAPQDVDALVKNVQGRIAEASKLSAAKEGLAQRSLRSDDLSRLLRSINAEACRIDLATFAYTHISDPQNFNRVYDAFETESGAKAVEQAVNNTSQR
ncbi:DUF4476 domain-containing protein [Hymenobacter siberiensis]|uniref:DUF4476 domain-containing protein n=1 Tax=Hymenobacter siberiensis TaxID=2848396 RepID=UPI001C1E869F|nr:DUF4476 domain-containing protein [Hymenobacter siberiensis]MBU6119907.1 DUF4476 domain-containing protein [Hymenobacter siberiensis]